LKHKKTSALFDFGVFIVIILALFLQQELSLIETLEDQGDLDLSTSPVKSLQLQHSLWMDRL